MKKINTKIPWSKPLLTKNDLTHLNNAFKSSWISGGDYVIKLQTLIKKHTRRKYTFATSNGTSAIHLAFLSLDLKRNDQVIVPAFGYMAAANIGKLMGLNISFCDVDINTYCLSLNFLKKVITKKTKAVVVINTYGNISDISNIRNFLKKKNIYMIEDSAESLGSKYKTNFAGSYGDISTFSFHATKNITTGEGGMILTNNKRIAKKISLYRSHGVDKKRYYHHLHGHNFRLSNLLAAVGYSQSLRMKSIIQKRKNIYQQYLKNIDLKLINIQKLDNKDIVPWTFAFTVKRNNIHKLKNFLDKNNIETRNGFYSASHLKIFNIKKNKFVNSDYLSKNVICLPFFLEISKSEISYICDKINNFLVN